jgi:cation diffusion facilitator CzcD-associated flavoprotein CzcO
MRTYIEDYAAKHGVTEKVRRAPVDSVEMCHSGGYSVHFREHGLFRVEKFDLVVVATGVYGKASKFIPAWPGTESFEGKIMHASDMTEASMCQGNVVVVGYGKSAFDCVQVAARQETNSATLLFRESHWCVPRNILGLVPFEYATFNRFGSACLLPKWPNASPCEHAVHATHLLPAFWQLVSEIFKFQFGLKGDLVPEKGFIDDFWCGHGVLPHPTFFSSAARGDFKTTKGEIKEIRPKSLLSKSGEEIDCDVLVAATGYKAGQSFLPAQLQSLKEDDGMWLYQNMVHPEFPNLIFLNSNTTTFTNITTASIQARWLAELLNGRFDLPTPLEMQEEIEKVKKWKRSEMPDAGSSRASMIQTHQVHYYDELLVQMGARRHRKQGCFSGLKECLDPYRPRDYNTIVTGEFKMRPSECAEPGVQQPASCFAFLPRNLLDWSRPSWLAVDFTFGAWSSLV